MIYRSLIFLLALLSSSVFAQTYTPSESYTALCDDTDPVILLPSMEIVIKDNSLFLEGYVNVQCCAEFLLEISDMVDGTIFVKFTDIAEEECDCMCDFTTSIEVGEYSLNIKKVNFNGDDYLVMPPDYKQLVEVGKKWVELTKPVTPNVYVEPTVSIINEDVPKAFCWNGKFYYKITTSEWDAEIVNYIREEDGRVYQFDPISMAADGCEEFLLYDFNVEVGDIVQLGPELKEFKVVPILKPVLTETNATAMEITETANRRCWGLVDMDYPELSEYALWIEGIGDTRGLFKSYLDLNMVGVTNELVCCSLMDEVLYQNPNYEDCSGATSVIVGSSSNLSLISNPVKNEIRVEGFSGKIFKYSIININGSVVQKGESDAVVVINLKAGIYFLDVYQDGNNVDRLKFVVQ